MNKVMLIGRLVREPEVRVATGQNSRQITVAKYTLAVDRKYKKDGENTADFISCVAMDRNGEFAQKYLTKGTKICVVGRIQTGSYTNKDGQKVYTTDVMVEEHEFVESKAGGQTTSQTTTDADGFVTIPIGIEDEGLPFA